MHKYWCILHLFLGHCQKKNKLCFLVHTLHFPMTEKKVFNQYPVTGMQSQFRLLKLICKLFTNKFSKRLLEFVDWWYIYLLLIALLSLFTFSPFFFYFFYFIMFSVFIICIIFTCFLFLISVSSYFIYIINHTLNYNW